MRPIAVVAIALVAVALTWLLIRSLRKKDATTKPPTSDWRLPPGCEELRRSRERDGLRWRLPLDDVAFRELCTATVMPNARGRCYRLKRNREVVKCLPSFLVVGFTKAGTSVFFNYASQHHLVRAARLKEPAYLGSDVEAAEQNASAADAGTSSYAGVSAPVGKLHGGRPLAKTLRWYMGLFPACATCERGEATPGYAWRDYSAIAAAQARLLLGGNAKLIMLVREPIERAASHYVYFREKRKAFRVANLSQVLTSALEEFDRCASQLGGWQHQCTYRSGRRQAEVAYAAIRRSRPELWRLKAQANYELLQPGLYSEHLTTWRAQFPAASIMVVDSAVLLATPMKVLRRFERHLGLPHFGGYEVTKENALASPRYGGPKPGVAAGHALRHQVEDGLRAQLETFFTPFNRKLRKATGIGWTYSR